jgi:hypothetical protein
MLHDRGEDVAEDDKDSPGERSRAPDGKAGSWRVRVGSGRNKDLELSWCLTNSLWSSVRFQISSVATGFFLLAGTNHWSQFRCAS